METRKEVKTHKIEYTCDSCGKGNMVHNGVRWGAYPIQYSHDCSHCGTKMYYTKSYPTTEQEEV